MTTARQAQLISARYNCGIGWLMNILMELNVEVAAQNGAWQEPYWQPAPGGVQISREASGEMERILPALHRRSVFGFEPGLEVLVEHYWNLFASHPERPTILYVRDPRDALYSLYLRCWASEMTYLEYLQRPCVYEQGPGDSAWCRMTPPEAWALYNLFWQTLSATRNVLIVRFEDMKADPTGETQRVLDFLAVQRSPDEVERALALSSFEHTRDVLGAAAARRGEAPNYARRGKSGEWKDIYGPQELACFAGLPNAALRQFGYEPVQPDDLGIRLETDTSTGDILSMAQEAKQTARAELGAGRPEAAVKILTQALQGDAHDFAQDENLAAALTALEWTQAVYGSALPQSPDAVRAFNLFDRVLCTFGQTPHLHIAQMEELIRRKPEHAAAYNSWGETLYGQGKIGEAERVFAQACRSGAESATVRNNLAVIYWQAGYKAEAWDQIQQARDLNAEHMGVRENLEAMEASILCVA